jgi:trans-aconitate methyltransferase
VLELGCGGGNNASHLREHFRLVLTDVSEDMLAVSRKLNPNCEHVCGDMRTLRLEREFDAVFVHDAVSYMLTIGDVRSAVRTAFAHCRPGGAALFAPDHFRESFRESARNGGHTAGDRSLRYLEWVWDPDPDDSTYVADFVYMLREGNEPVRIVHDPHILGIFPRQAWLDIISETGFVPEPVPFEHSEVDPGSELLLAIRPCS